jgi:hypothetical protein
MTRSVTKAAPLMISNLCGLFSVRLGCEQLIHWTSSGAPDFLFANHAGAGLFSR